MQITHLFKIRMATVEAIFVVTSPWLCRYFSVATLRSYMAYNVCKIDIRP